MARYQLFLLSYPHSPVITFRYNSTRGPCSKSCNRGFRIITNTCIRLIDGMEDMAVDAQLCRDFGLEDPPTTEDCGLDQCPRWVVNSEFGQVSLFQICSILSGCLLILLSTYQHLVLDYFIQVFRDFHNVV